MPFPLVWQVPEGKYVANRGCLVKIGYICDFVESCFANLLVSGWICGVGNWPCAWANGAILGLNSKVQAISTWADVWHVHDVAVGQKYGNPKTGCPGQWKRGLKPTVFWWIHFDPYPHNYQTKRVRIGFHLNRNLFVSPLAWF